ncbi:cytochrome c [Dyella japonica]|uniref:cytochrome c n=1 Tax=Dyella japonica TaxID=231455 RepID=UPI000A2F4C30|nr:cytochrome c [Dyella japonica]
MVLIALLLLAWLVTLLVPRGGDATATAPPPTEEQIRQGEYLAKLGDCVACHTAKDGKPFAGGLPIASPIGVIYSTNITPDRDTGIGRYSYGQFERAVRRGVAASGDTLYPAMPYPSYAKVSDEDVQALYAYFLHGVAPEKQENHRNGITWPLSMRWPLTYWRWLFGPNVTSPQTALTLTPEQQRGEYLVEGLGHCGACHTPRSVTLQEKALGTSGGLVYLSGGESDNWIAPSLRGESESGLGNVSADDLVVLLKMGRSDRSAIFGGMADVVQHSTQYMNDEDLRAVALFLKSLPPERKEATLVYDQATQSALHAGNVSAPGSQLYLDNCATCHRTDGRGYVQVFPALADNPLLNSDNPDSLIRLVLQGGTMPSGRDAPTQFSMPAFRNRLSDAQVAALLTFVRSSWGNRGGPVDPRQVARLRALPSTDETMMSSYDPRMKHP